MTDLERVRKVLQMYGAKHAEDILDAHLKEDAERDERLARRVIEKRALQDELAELREAARALLYDEPEIYESPTELLAEETVLYRLALERVRKGIECIVTEGTYDRTIEASLSASSLNTQDAELAELKEAASDCLRWATSTMEPRLALENIAVRLRQLIEEKE